MSDENKKGSIVRTVHTAWDKLLAGDLAEALAMLRSVESECGSYSSFHVVLSSAFLSRKEYGEALRAAERALELTPDSPHAKLIAELARERIGSQTSALSAPKFDQSRRTLAAMLDPENVEEVPHFNIDRTADELTRERPLVRPIPEPEHIQAIQLPEPEDAPALVSETLAEIMIRQGKLSDAKKVYIQLARSHPERYAHFKTKIEAIDKLLLGTSIAPEKTLSESTDNDPVA